MSDPYGRIPPTANEGGKVNKYMISVVGTYIYDVEVEADTLDEAKDVAMLSTDNWVKDELASDYRVGSDHFILKDNEWSPVQ